MNDLDIEGLKERARAYAFDPMSASLYFWPVAMFDLIDVLTTMQADLAAANARALKAENALEMVLVEIEAAKAFGGGWFGTGPTDDTREFYRKQARSLRARAALKGQSKP